MKYSIDLSIGEKESFLSYFCRASDELVISPFDFRKELGLVGPNGHSKRYKDIDWWCWWDGMEDIEESLCIPSGFIKQMLIWRYGCPKPSNILRDLIKMNMDYYLYNTTKYCPECLQESPHWKIEWKAKELMTCRKHGRPLLTECPHCNSKIISNDYTSMYILISKITEKTGIPFLSTCLECGGDLRYRKA